MHNLYLVTGYKLLVSQFVSSETVPDLLLPAKAAVHDKWLPAETVHMIWLPAMTQQKASSCEQSQQEA